MKKILSLILGMIMLIGCDNSTNLEDKIGLNIKSEQMQKFLKTMGEPEISKIEARLPNPAITNQDGTNTIQEASEGRPAVTYYTFKDKGLEILLNEKDIVITFFLFGEGKSGHRQYQGSLPFDLKFTDTRQIVNEKFGKSEGTFSGSVEFNFQCVDSWKKTRGISVTYNTTDSTDMDATISLIVLQKPNDK